MADFSPAFAHLDASKRMPTAGEVDNGFGCGPADLNLFNGLFNALYLELGALITLTGGAPSNANMQQIAEAVQSGGLNWAVATGTANAWTIAPALAVPAYAAGRRLWIKAPATNTSTTVNANVSTLGNRRIKKGDGTDPAVGDLIIGRWYPTIDDGTNICVVSTLTSDILAQINASGQVPQLNFFELKTAATQSVPNAAVTVVNDFTVVGSKASDAVFSAGGLITIGPKTAGWWNFTQMYVPSQSGGAPSTTQAYLYKNGVNIQNSTNPATFCSNAGTVRVAPGDVLSMAVYQNSGGGRVSRWAAANPPDTTFNLNQISGA